MANTTQNIVNRAGTFFSTISETDNFDTLNLPWSAWGPKVLTLQLHPSSESFSPGVGGQGEDTP